MRYCTPEDLALAVPRETLAQLSNDDAPEDGPDMAVLERVVSDAEDLIDGYLRGRYDLPFPSAPSVVRRITVDLARHGLYARRPEGGDDLPDAVVRAYKAGIETLKAIRDGGISLGVPETQGAQPEPASVRTKRSGGRRFSADLLSKYR
uniref:Mu-like prophage protein gp36 n=1 Tax=Candidatus Kentrum sp. LFY TaxID=2126342 RepID=A0A450WH00_9GAMM|nr:MAG: Mu-like prophage protein gp36 [Candidatus Kentron sp. LFY]